MEETNITDLIETLERDDLPTNEFTTEDTDPLVLLGKMNEITGQLGAINASIEDSDASATQALFKANNALAIGEQALEASVEATRVSGQAITGATTALSSATSALSSANTALTNSQTAIETANDALSQVVSGTGTKVKINNVVQSEINFDSNPQTQIDEIQTQVATNSTDVANLSTGLQQEATTRATEIAQEQAIRAQADTTLQNNITAEAQARASADTYYAGQLDGINTVVTAIATNADYIDVNNWLTKLNIAESGSNYMRLYDGTQICWGECSQTGTPTISLPVAFINTTYKVAILPTSTSSSTTTMRSISTYSKTTTTFVRGQQSADFGCGYIAIGKWK